MTGIVYKCDQFHKTLKYYIESAEPVLSGEKGASNITQFICQITDAMNYLSSKDVIHGNLNTSNIYCFGDDSNSIQLKLGEIRSE